MVQNGVQNGAKCKSESIKNTPQWYNHNLFFPLKTWFKRAKHPLKSGILGAKCRFLGVQKQRTKRKLERQNGAKCRLFA